MIWYLAGSLIKGRKYLRIGFKNNKSLSWSIGSFTIESMHAIIKISISITSISNIINR